MDVFGGHEALGDRSRDVAGPGRRGRERRAARFDDEERVPQRGAVDLAAGRVVAHRGDVGPAREPLAPHHRLGRVRRGRDDVGAGQRVLIGGHRAHRAAEPRPGLVGERARLRQVAPGDADLAEAPDARERAWTTGMIA